MKPHQHAMGIATVLLVVVILQGLLSPHYAETEESTPESAATTASPYQKTILSPPRPQQLISDYAPATPNTAAATFMGRPCPRLDCASELAGYHWAQENRISDPDNCAGSSGEFVAGCRLYVSIERQYNL